MWKVRTRAGERVFQTALDTWPRDLADGTHVIENVFGDIYRFPALGELDPQSVRRLWSMVG